MKQNNMLKLFNLPFKEIKENLTSLSVLTPLGRINLCINLNGTNLSSSSLKTKGVVFSNSYIYIWNCKDFHVELLRASIKPKIPAQMHVDSCVAFLCRFKCLSGSIKSRFTCHLEFDKKKLEASPESGERLIAQSWQNANTKITIGTEDSESLFYRAKYQKGLPHRWATNQLINFELIEYLDNGIELTLPKLLKNEEGQVHFVFAWTKITSINSSATWFAVDVFPEEILGQLLK